MPKGTNSITPASPRPGTHPVTRTIDTSRAGEKGSVRATPVPVPTIASTEARAQKPQRPQVPVSVESIPVTPAEAAKVPSPAPPDVTATIIDPGKSVK